jgi:hypothetical protein
MAKFLHLDDNFFPIDRIIRIELALVEQEYRFYFERHAILVLDLPEEIYSRPEARVFLANYISKNTFTWDQIMSGGLSKLGLMV